MFAKSEPEGDGGESKHGQIVVSAFLIAGSDPTVLLESVDESLHTVAFAVDSLIEATLAFVAFVRNGYPDPPPPQIPPYPRTAVALIPYHSAGPLLRSTPSRSPDLALLHEALKHHRLVSLSCRQHKRYGLTLSFGS